MLAGSGFVTAFSQSQLRIQRHFPIGDSSASGHKPWPRPRPRPIRAQRIFGFLDFWLSLALTSSAGWLATHPTLHFPPFHPSTLPPQAPKQPPPAAASRPAPPSSLIHPPCHPSTPLPLQPTSIHISQLQLHFLQTTLSPSPSTSLVLDYPSFL
jgi:hypothetical protein